jgi:CHASE1-domain containing sensor protein
LFAGSSHYSIVVINLGLLNINLPYSNQQQRSSRQFELAAQDDSETFATAVWNDESLDCCRC